MAQKKTATAKKKDPRIKKVAVKQKPMTPSEAKMPADKSKATVTQKPPPKDYKWIIETLLADIPSKSMTRKEIMMRLQDALK